MLNAVNLKEKIEPENFCCQVYRKVMLLNTEYTVMHKFGTTKHIVRTNSRF